jgi:hypothetical protein
MGLNKFKNYINYLLKNDLASKQNGHLQLHSINKLNNYYKSKITIPANSTFEIIKELLLLEYYKHQKFAQDKIISLRETVAYQLKKTTSKVNKQKLDIYTSLDESYFNEALITYRTTAKTLNINLNTAFEMTKKLKAKGLLGLKTICINTKIFISTNLEHVKDSLDIKSYCYTYNNYLYLMLGSQILFTK